VGVRWRRKWHGGRRGKRQRLGEGKINALFSLGRVNRVWLSALLSTRR
jgi:hypothetical protein